MFCLHSLQLFKDQHKKVWYAYLDGIINLEITVPKYGQITFTNGTKPSLLLSGSKFNLSVMCNKLQIENLMITVKSEKGLCRMPSYPSCISAV